MALSPAHRWGQIIGEILEDAIESHLQQFATTHKLYLDKHGKRTVRGKKQKVRWQDTYGNFHDLDFVLERGGSDTEIGVPVAFVESAWRRYTKHSRNKAQEIQGALIPIMEVWKNAAPRKAAILAGVFTEDAITQMRSVGFHVALLDRADIVPAFQCVNIDADYDEATPTAVFTAKVDAWEALSDADKTKVVNAIAKLLAPKMKALETELINVLKRYITSVRVLPLHGTSCDCMSVASAIQFIQDYEEDNAEYPFVKYEIQIRYNNGDKIDGQFQDKRDSLEFLQTFDLSVAYKLKAMQDLLVKESNSPEE